VDISIWLELKIKKVEIVKLTEFKCWWRKKNYTNI